jgi:uncharacterized membrane protein (DUF106 family)
MSQTEKFSPFAIPLKMGVLIALVKIILSTIQYQFFAEQMTTNLVVSFLSFVLGVILLYVTGSKQRKAMGGFIEIKQAFQAMFVAILIFVIVGFLYDLLYQHVIDPTLTERIKTSTISFAEKMGAPQEKLDEMAEQFDEQQRKSTDIGTLSLSLFSMIVWYSIIGFIMAAILKKRKPIVDSYN